MFKLTLTPNRSNPPRFAALVTYSRKGDKVTRLLKRYSARGAVTGAKTIPYDRRDWSRVPGERYTMVPDHGEASDKAMQYTASDYANGVPLPTTPRVTRETKRARVQQTAKRDWLIEVGAICTTGDCMAPRQLEWVPGDEVYADSIHADTGREVECYEDIDEDNEDCAIVGGHFKVKE